MRRAGDQVGTHRDTAHDDSRRQDGENSARLVDEPATLDHSEPERETPVEEELNGEGDEEPVSLPMAPIFR